MNVFRLAPVALSALLLAAHFSRAGFPLMVIISLAAPLLLFVRRPWVARLMQIGLVLGALEWVRTLIVIAVRWQGLGEPWLRMAAILGTVALLTALSALVFQGKNLKERYSQPQRELR